MLKIQFYSPGDVRDDQLRFAVIITKNGGRWVFCKHKDRETYEFPGGHHEAGETILQTANRELYEETGALDYTLTQICAYSVTGRTSVNSTGEELFGMLFFADIRTFDPELHFEIESLLITDTLPQDWTYPEIQPVLMGKAMEIRRDQASTFDPERLIPLNEENRPVVNAFIKERWFSTDMVIHGEIVDLSNAEGFLLLQDGRISALVTYRIRGNLCDILSLDSRSECHGVGSALIERVAKTAKSRGCSRVVVVTTNDNLNAIRFYQKRGFDMTRLYYNALEKSRMIKPEIPLIGENGIPLRHEIEFERKI